ncbi:centromere protein W [Amazona aestiva]|uniref:Centromere protein W n=1 Tax=Amazona aestiva TaxID=12930 RepID=A0A0Q3LTR5_AMAAE|nr:centromere protein W [Amazona aestiva]
MGRAAPRAALRKMLKNEKPGFRLSACADLLVRKERGGHRVRGLGLVHLNFLLFLRRLAEEARTNAFQNRSRIIKPEHIILAAKAILKKSRG